MADADEQQWDAKVAELGNNPTPEVAKVCRYRSAQRRARAMGVLFQPVEILAAKASVEELVERVKVATGPHATEAIADAVLGATPEPAVTIRDALTLYFDKLAIDELRVKSPAQAAKWRPNQAKLAEGLLAYDVAMGLDGGHGTLREVAVALFGYARIEAEWGSNKSLKNYAARA